MAKKAAKSRFNGNWATIPSKKARKEHNGFMVGAGLGGTEPQVESRPIGTCSHCRKTFTDVTVDALRRQLHAHWEQAHRKGAPAPMVVPPTETFNGNYPIVSDKKDEDTE